MGQKQKDAPIFGTDTPSLSRKVDAPLRNCKVVLKNKTIYSVAGKHNTLKQCQYNPKVTPSCDTVENKSINN